MRKVLFIVLLLMTILVASCNDNKETEEVKISMPDGTPALAMAKVLDEGFTYKNKVASFKLVQAAMITAEVSSKACDLAIIPTTAAATLYSKGTKIKLATVNVFGNLYIVGTNSQSSLADMKGKIIYTTVGTTNDMVKYLLDKANIGYVEGSEVVNDKVVLSSQTDGSAIIQLLAQAKKQEKEAYGVLGEPAVTNALNKVTGLNITFDLQKLYKDATGYDGYPQACLVVQEDFYKNNKDFVNSFIKALKTNEDYLKNNLEKLSDVFGKYESTLAGMNFVKDTITRSNITIKEAKDIKQSVKEYVKDLTATHIELDEEFFC